MATTKITVNNNGSLRVEGDFEIVDKEGNKYGLQGRELVSICRCGRSQNKPLLFTVIFVVAILNFWAKSKNL